MVSDTGDYIGQGRTYDFSLATGTFTIQGNANYFTLYYGGGQEQLAVGVTPQRQPSVPRHE